MPTVQKRSMIRSLLQCRKRKADYRWLVQDLAVTINNISLGTSQLIEKTCEKVINCYDDLEIIVPGLLTQFYFLREARLLSFNFQRRIFQKPNFFNIELLFLVLYDEYEFCIFKKNDTTL